MGDSCSFNRLFLIHYPYTPQPEFLHPGNNLEQKFCLKQQSIRWIDHNGSRPRPHCGVITGINLGTTKSSWGVTPKRVALAYRATSSYLNAFFRVRASALVNGVVSVQTGIEPGTPGLWIRVSSFVLSWRTEQESTWNELGLVHSFYWGDV